METQVKCSEKPNSWYVMRWVWVALIMSVASPVWSSYDKQILRLKNFGGINDTTVPTQIEDNQSPDCRNVRFPLGALQKRKGYENAASGVVSSASFVVNGLYQVFFSGGTQVLLASSNSQIRRLDGTTWTDITGAVLVSGTASDRVDWTTFTDLAIGSDNVNPMFKWTGTGNASALSGCPATAAKAIAEYRNYLILGNTLESGTRCPTRIRWSEINNAESWDTLDFATLSDRAGDEILDLVPLGDSLYVFMRRSIWQMQYTGDALVPFVFSIASPNRGAVSAQGQARVENVLYFASDDGLYRFDGGSPQYFSKRVEVTYGDRNTGQDAQIVAVNNRPFNEVWFGFSYDTANTNDLTVMYDTEVDQFSVSTGITMTCGLEFLNSNGSVELLTGAPNGKVYRQNTTDNDDGALINAYYRTKWFDFGDSFRYKTLQELQLESNSEGVTQNVSVCTAFDFTTEINCQSYSLRHSSAATFGSAIFGTGVFPSESQVIVQNSASDRGKFVQFLIKNAIASESFTILGLTVGLQPEDQ